jgi:hypothetical protein
MKKLIIIIIALLPLMASAQMDDKLKHKLVSHAIVNIGGYAMYKATNKVGLSMLTSIATSFLIGYGKEKYDQSQGRGFSKDDMIANINGIAVGTVCLAVCIDLNKIKINKREQLQSLKFE